MAPKNGEKFEEILYCRFKIDIRNLMNIDSSSTRKSEKFEI